MKQKTYFKAAPPLKLKLPPHEELHLTEDQETLVDVYLHYVSVKMMLDALEDRYVRARPEEKHHYAKLMAEHAKLQLAALEKLASLES